MILCITGAKTFTNKVKLFSFLDSKLSKIEKLTCGSCKNIDNLIKEYCETRGLICMIFNSRTHNLDGSFNNGAIMRNRGKLIRESTHVLVLDDGKSEGAKLSIEMAQKYNKKLKVIKFTPENKESDKL